MTDPQPSPFDPLDLDRWRRPDGTVNWIAYKAAASEAAAAEARPPVSGDGGVSET
jgi:hypothetical protein